MIQTIEYPDVYLPKYEPSKSIEVKSFLKKEIVNNNIRFKFYLKNSDERVNSYLYYNDIYLVFIDFNTNTNEIFDLINLLKMFRVLNDNNLLQNNLKIRNGWLLCCYENHYKISGFDIELQKNDLFDLLECLQYINNFLKIIEKWK